MPIWRKWQKLCTIIGLCSLIFLTPKVNHIKLLAAKWYNEVLKREIPENWEVGSMSEIAILNPTLSIKKNSLAQYIEMASIPTKGYMTSKPAQREFSGGVKFQNGDIVVARITPCLENGKTALITQLEKDNIGFGSTEFITIRGKNSSYTSFLALLARSESFRKYAISKMTGTSGRKRVDAKDLCNFNLPIPPDHLLQKFGNILDVYFEKMTVNTRQNQQLSALRDWLLPMLISGQVKVESSSMSTDNNASMASESQTGYRKIVPLTIPENKRGFAKQVLAGKIVSKFIDDPNFTDIKFQKIQFLAEHVIEADLNLNYYCQAAGPYDNKFMHAIYNDFQKQRWFDFKKKRFIPLDKQEKIEGYYQGYYAPAQDQLNKLFELLYTTSEAEAEIIATLYAVWNNRIIESQTIADEELINDFYLWSDRKQQYTKKQVSTGLQWLKKYQWEPKGFGKLIKKAKPKS
jgi:type I restriction enzyme S subunit